MTTVILSKDLLIREFKQPDAMLKLVRFQIGKGLEVGLASAVGFVPRRPLDRAAVDLQVANGPVVQARVPGDPYP